MTWTAQDWKSTPSGGDLSHLKAGRWRGTGCWSLGGWREALLMVSLHWRTSSASKQGLVLKSASTD
jgi:hypothetical protein